MKQTTTDAIFSIRLDKRILERIKQKAWLLSEGGLKKLSYTQLIREVIEREYGESSEVAGDYDPRAELSSRVIPIEGERR